MYPSQCDEIMLVLNIKEFLFGERFARVRSPSLLGEDHVSHVKLVTRLARREIERETDIEGEREREGERQI